MPETTPLIKAALNLRGGAGFDVYNRTSLHTEVIPENIDPGRPGFAADNRNYPGAIWKDHRKGNTGLHDQ